MIQCAIHNIQHTLKHGIDQFIVVVPCIYQLHEVVTPRQNLILYKFNNLFYSCLK